MSLSASLRLTLYLFVFLLGTLLASLFSPPLSEAVQLLAVLSVMAAERFVFQKRATALLPAPARRTLLVCLFPCFCFSTLLFSTLFSHLFAKLGMTAPLISPSFPLFIGAVLLAPIAEELFFRGVVLRLLLPLGEGWGVLLSAFLFALAHGSFFQMPYAFVAGIFLSLAALWGASTLVPILFHIAYNLLAFFEGELPLLFTLAVCGALSLLSLLTLARSGVYQKPKWGTFSARPLLPLLIYAAVMLTLAAIQP